MDRLRRIFDGILTRRLCVQSKRTTSGTVAGGLTKGDASPRFFENARQLGSFLVTLRVPLIPDG
jgi:hypothetical protein